jgi:hypothetical protein
MIYDLPLQTTATYAGSSSSCWVSRCDHADGRRAGGAQVPALALLGIVLLTAAFVWSLWLLWTMEMGEFSSFRRPLLIALPIGFLLVLRFVNEFLAVRAFGILCLLAAEPLLESAFLRYEQSRLLVTVFAYILIVLGLFWVSLPYLLATRSIGSLGAVRAGFRSAFWWRSTARSCSSSPSLASSLWRAVSAADESHIGDPWRRDR